MLAPFAPHLAEELWHELGNQDSVHSQQWPNYDPKKIEAESIELAVQINGKFRGSLVVPRDAKQKEVEQAVFAEARFERCFENKQVERVVFVKNRLINFVLRPS
jgi:leucyl-tRNA synthetase